MNFRKLIHVHNFEFKYYFDMKENFNFNQYQKYI